MFKHKSNTVATLEAELAALQERQGALAGQLTEAHAEAEQAMAARRAFLLDGNANDAEARREVDQRVVAVQARELGLEDAIAELDQHIAGAKQRLAEVKDRLERETETARRE